MLARMPAFIAPQTARRFGVFEGSHRREGMWLDRAFPRIGWRCQGMEDVGDPGRSCEMCGAGGVRYIHLLVHDAVPQVMAVGTECALDMEGDFDRPKRRLRAFELEERIRREWIKRTWKVSKRGNYFVNTRGFNIATFHKGNEGYGIAIRLQNTFNEDDAVSFVERYTTLQQAQRAGVEALFWARFHLAEGDRFDDWRALCGEKSEVRELNFSVTPISGWRSRTDRNERGRR